jgi:hypothetical protein
MKNLIKTLKKVSLLILAISFIGCDDDEAVLPQLTAGFTYTINSSTGTVTFINTSINASMYEWDFGDESTSNLINPVNVYENGTYLVVLKSSNVAGAFDIFSDEITINVTEVEETCDAETAESLSASDFNMTFMSDPTASIISDGAGFSWIDNPDFENDVNASCKVGQINRTSAAQYANNQLILDAKLDFDSNSGFKLKVWSQTASTPVLLKLEDQTNSSIFNEVSATTSADSAGAWEELTFDFESADSNKFDKVVVFFELGTSTEQTYYIDDLMLYGEGNGGGGGGGTCTTETMESYNAANLNMTFQTASADFISDGAGFSWVDNPDFDNTVNTSCKVGKVVRGNNNPWDNNQYDLDAKLDFNANTGLKIKVWSARPNTEVRLKLEEIGNAGNNSEKFLTTSVTSGWEELTFPFTAADSDRFNKIVIFFDLNTTSTDTYYFDDLKLYGSGNSGGGGGGSADGDISSNGGFESGTLDGWTLYANGGSATLDNTEAQTGDWCVKLFASAPSGLNPTLKQERKAAGSIVVGDEVQVTFSYKGSLTGESGTVSIQSFVEATNGASQIETFNVTPTNTWQTFTTTYTVTGALQGGDVSGGITMEFVAICGGVAGCTSTLYLDDISIILNP